MTLRAPHFAVVPESMVEALGSWLKHLVSTLGVRTGQSGKTSPPTPAGASMPELRLAAAGSNDDCPTEHPVFFARSSPYSGSSRNRPQQELRRRGVILLNAGADYHMGASRLYVSLARRWARSGYYVLRMDLAGLGDSNTRAGKTDDEIFPTRALDDIRKRGHAFARAL